MGFLVERFSPSNPLRGDGFLLPVLFGAFGLAGCVSKPTLEMFREDDPPCYDRSGQPQTAVVDTHVHFRPFGGVAIPSEETVSYLEETVSYLKEASVLFANIYGIGQTLPPESSLHVLLKLPRNARDADVQKQFRQCRQLQHKRLNGCPFDACDDLPGLVATRVDSSWDAAVGEGVPGRLQVDGRGQSGEAGLVRQWAGAGLRRPGGVVAVYGGAPGNGAFPSRFMRI